jgi:hypothetical protein
MRHGVRNLEVIEADEQSIGTSRKPLPSCVKENLAIFKRTFVCGNQQRSTANTCQYIAVVPPFS